MTEVRDRVSSPTMKLPYEDGRILKCPAIPWNGNLVDCRACNKPLTGRQKRWCSEACKDWYGRNHFWTLARPARIVLDDFTCQRCGVRSEPRLSQWEWYRRHGWENADGVLIKQVQANKLWTGPPLEVNHVWPLAHQRRPGKKWDRERGFVEGVVPVKHADSGCHHHLSLLMTLCRPCHRRITNQQFGHKQVAPSSQLALEVAS